MNNIRNITVIGAGNIGTQFACVAAAKGYNVTVYSSKPQTFSGTITAVDGDNNIVCTGTPKLVTADIKEALCGADLVFITYPANMFAATQDLILPHIKSGMNIGVIPGTGGAEFAFRKCINKGAVLFGLQRVPSVARLVKYGETVCMQGLRDSLHLASIPSSRSKELSRFISGLFDIPCVALPNYLCVTMTPSNPILHTTRLATMFEDYTDGTIYPKNPLFYGEWSDSSSKRLLDCDAEHQNMLKRLSKLDLSSVKSLVEHYDNSDTPQKMTAKITGIKSLHNLLSPMVQKDGGWVPDFSSRYFVADFPFGLAIIEELAKIIGAPTPNINKTMRWYKEVTKDTHRLNLSDYGINTVDDIYELYK